MEVASAEDLLILKMIAENIEAKDVAGLAESRLTPSIPRSIAPLRKALSLRPPPASGAIGRQKKDRLTRMSSFRSHRHLLYNCTSHRNAIFIAGIAMTEAIVRR